MALAIDFGVIYKLFLFMGEASLETLKLFSLTLIFSLPLGMIVTMGRMLRYGGRNGLIKGLYWILQAIIRFYLLVMRGTPLILQLFFFYYFPYYVLSGTLPRFGAAVLALTLNYAAYFAEIYRSGFESMPRGQYEAAAVLGFTKPQRFVKIILPQVVKRILPPMGNEFMTLVKDTALVSVIGVVEIYGLATDWMSSMTSMVPLVMAGVFYLVMNAVVSRCFSLAEKKLSYYN